MNGTDDGKGQIQLAILLYHYLSWHAVCRLLYSSTLNIRISTEIETIMTELVSTKGTLLNSMSPGVTVIYQVCD